MKIQIKSRWDGKVLWEGEAASLREAIEIAVKQKADLCGSDLSEAKLGAADLSGADLCGSDLFGANLSGTDLSGADLYDANLSRANLSGAGLYGANLSKTNLYEVDFSGAGLSRANLSEANLSGANLSRANLYGVDLSEANLDVKIPPICSHQFISEILFRTARKEAEKDFAARIRMETNQCWKYFIGLAERTEVMAWAKKTLFQWKEFKEKFEKEAG